MSFRLKTIIGIAIIQIIFSGLLISREYHFFKQTSHDQLLQTGQTTAKLLATMTANAVLASDLATLNDLVAQTLDNKGVIYARVRNSEGIILSEKGNPKTLGENFSEDGSIADALSDQRLDLSHEIIFEGKTYGQAEIGIAIFLINNAMRESLSRMLSTVVGEVFLLGIFGFIFGTYLTRQLSGLRNGACKIASGDFGHQINVTGKDELADTAKAFNQMSNSLAEQRDMIKKQTEDLKHTLAKEKELNELQRQFVSMASHEFRTPLAIIDATAQRIKSRADKNRLTPEEAVQRVEKIRDAVKRMMRLMESTLSVASMEEGKIKVEIKSCDIGSAVRDVCDRQQEISKSHIISCDLADLPVTIQADTGSVEQVLTNLLSNAVKYALDAPDIEVKARTESDQVVISVGDHGLGIDEDELERIGERFFRARTSTGIAGTGIGLNLAKTLVEMHGGSISIESIKGEGSTFTVRLPIAGPDQTELAETRVA